MNVKNWPSTNRIRGGQILFNNYIVNLLKDIDISKHPNNIKRTGYPHSEVWNTVIQSRSRITISRLTVEKFEKDQRALSILLSKFFNNFTS